MFCPKCGTENSGDAAFCKECGNPINQASKATSQPVQATAKAVKATNVAGAAASVVADGVSSIAKKGGINPKIIGIVAVVIIALLIIFGITQCSGGGPLQNGTYTVKYESGGSSYSAKIDGNKITTHLFGREIALTYDKAGNKGDSVLYDLKIVSADGKDAKYDNDGYLTNGADILGSSDDLMKLKIQLLLPNGALTGKPVGMWGFLFTGQRASSNMYAAMLFDAKEGGDLIAYTANGSVSDVNNFPELTIESMMAASGSRTEDDCSYTKLTDTAYTVDLDGTKMNVTYTK